MPQMKIGRGGDAAAAGADRGRAKAAIRLIDEGFLLSPVIENDARPGAFPAVPIGRGIGVERLIVGAAGIEHLAECEAEIRLVRRRSGLLERSFQSADQRVIGSGHLFHVGIAGERDAGIRIERQDPLAERERLVPLPEVRLEVGEIEERRDILRIERQRRLELRFCRVVAAQAIRVDDAAVEMDFLRARNAAVERLPVGGERGVEAARGALQHGEVVPGIRQIGRARRAAARTRPEPPAGGRRAAAASPRATARRSPRSSSRQSFPQDGLPGCRCAEMIARAAGRRGDRLACGAPADGGSARPTTGGAGSTAATGAWWT